MLMYLNALLIPGPTLGILPLIIVNQGAAAPCTPALCVGNMSVSEICPCWKYVHVGNMSVSEIWYAHSLVGNMTIEKVAVEKMVFGKKSRRD